MNLSEIKSIVETNMKHRRSHDWKERGNKFYHGERVANLALTLRQLLFPTDASHDEILTVAAWFHDVMNGTDDHAQKGAEKTRRLIDGLCTPDELDEICGIIAVHDDRFSDRALFSNWVKIHQDADHLDHFGTYEIWAMPLYAISHDHTIGDELNYLFNERKLDFPKHRSELNFEISREIYDEKIEYLKKFTERFALESAGGVWDINRITGEHAALK